jgi:hypothetical protein
MKNFFLLLIATVFFSSCADEKTFKIDGETVVVKPYGWGNYQTNRHDSVIYEPVIGNIVWSVILFETIVAPIYFTGWAIMEPVQLKNPPKAKIRISDEVLKSVGHSVEIDSSE